MKNMVNNRAIVCVLLAVVTAVTRPVEGIEFDLVFQTKCVYEEIIFESNVLLKFDAFQQSSRDSKVPLTVRVMDEAGEERFSKVDVDHLETTLSNFQEGRYKICFTAKNYHTAQNTRINFVWEEGVDSTDWESVAKRDKMDAVHTELLRLEEAAHVMHYELQHIRRKEEEMRDVNEKTNSLVAFLSIGALFTCVGLAVFQVWTLRKFFKRKKVL